MAKAKTVIRWKPVAMADPSDRTKTIVTPSIVDRQDSIDLGQLVEQAIDTGRIAGVKPEFSQAIGEALAAQIGATLKSGRGVKFGQYFYVRLYLNGTLESMKSALGAENRLNAVLVPGNELRLAKDDFTFRNVLDTGDNPTIDNVFNADVSGENDVIGDWSRAIAITGSYLKGATITASWKEGSVTKKSAVQTPLQMDSNPLLQFLMDPSAVDPDAGITGGVPADNTMVTFEVVVARTVEGQTTFVKDTKEVLYKTPDTPPSPPTPSNPPVLTNVHGEDDDDVNLGGCDVSVYGVNIEGATEVQFWANDGAAPFYTMEAEYNPLTCTLDGHADYTGSAPQRGYAKVTTAGGSATRAVEFSNH